MKFLTKVKEVAKKAVAVIKKEKTAMMFAITTTMLMPSPVYATITVGDSQANGEMDNMMGTVIGIMCDIARYAGMALAVWGIVKAIMAYKDDNVNEITQGIRLAIVGILLITIKTVIKAFNFIN